MKRNENTKIIGEKVILIPYEEQHVRKYHKWMEDDEMLRLTRSERLTLAEEYEMQRKWRLDDDKLTFIVLSRAVSDTGCSEVESMIGDVNLFLSTDRHSGELEVMIAEQAARCSGAATEAVSLLISYALKELKLKNFFAKITEDNMASLHLFERKLHFKRISYSEVFGEFTLELAPSAPFDEWRKATVVQYRV
uniref:N-acetyltransferase domain-containing protein n=1 Tax=Angiostrongylus cantonensis TaxID=6313 RepID=A0A0K0DE74_ANGCA